MSSRVRACRPALCTQPPCERLTGREGRHRLQAHRKAAPARNGDAGAERVDAPARADALGHAVCCGLAPAISVGLPTVVGGAGPCAAGIDAYGRPYRTHALCPRGLSGTSVSYS
jgi:hypothetical protein